MLSNHQSSTSRNKQQTNMTHEIIKIIVHSWFMWIKWLATWWPSFFLNICVAQSRCLSHLMSMFPQTLSEEKKSPEISQLKMIIDFVLLWLLTLNNGTLTCQQAHAECIICPHVNIMRLYVNRGNPPRDESSRRHWASHQEELLMPVWGLLYTY